MMFRNSVKYIAVISISFISFCSICVADTPNPDDILRKVKMKYGSLNSYSDKGYVVGKSGTVEFESKFKKPYYYILRCTKNVIARYSQGPKIISKTNSVLLSNDNGVFTFYNSKNDIYDTTTAYESIESAIHASLLDSWAVSLYIPPLFFENVDTVRITDLVDAQLLEKSHNENAKYYIIKGKDSKGISYELWIEKVSLLIRKIVEDDFCYCFEMVESDIEIPDKAFNK